jgi:putative ABC transport system permease protein
MTYAVAQRTKEIGIRMALGSRASDVVALVVEQGLTLTALGLALGGAGALATGHLIHSFLHGVRGADPLDLPPRRAGAVDRGAARHAVSRAPGARVNPLVAIRQDQSR